MKAVRPYGFGLWYLACFIVFFTIASAKAQLAAFPSTGVAGVQLPGKSAPNTDEFDDEDAVSVSGDHSVSRERELRPAGQGSVASALPDAAAQSLDGAPSVAPLPNTPIVREIEIAGASAEDVKKARRAIRTREGEPLDPDKQREDVDRLYDLGIFRPDIQIQAEKTAGGVKLKYVVFPNPKVNQITIAGNMAIPEKKIIGQLPVKAGETFSIQAQNKIRESVSSYYAEKGYTSAAVKVEERPGPGNTVDLAISVDEGSKIKINDLELRGNRSIGDLRMLLRVKNKGSWGPLKHYFNESKFQEDIETIKALYNSRGFLDADVKRGEFVYAQDRSWVNPVIEINEGPRYKVGRLEGRGYTLFSREEILDAFRGLQGQYYDAKKLGASADKVQNMYGDEGFLMCKVQPDFHKDPSRGMVDIDLDVSEGPRIYVGNVRIVSEGFKDDETGWLRRFYSRFSPPVKDEVVQREVRLRPGQVYRRFDEVKTRERLESLKVFEDVKIHNQLSSDACVRDCIIDVKQGDTGNLIFGVGFGDVEGAFVYASYVEHNLFGMARDLRVSGLIGSRAESFDISYLDRYFLGMDVASQFSVYHHDFRRSDDFHQITLGTSAEFTRPLSDCLNDSIRLRLEDISFDFEDDDDLPANRFDDYIAATVRYRLSRDTRDDAFFPTSGNVLSGSVETGEADGFLMKFEGQYATYMCVGDTWVYAFNAHGGLLPYDFDEIGYADRFFLGGSQDMRGFRLAGVGPHDNKNEDIPLGGATKLVFQNELRYPFSDSITGVLFADVGMLSREPVDLASPRASVGTGVRLRLPIAQFAIDLGVPVVKKERDETQVFHFNVTSRF